MAYSGSTAATTVANPPRRIVGGIATPPQSTSLTTNPTRAPGGQGGSIWYYCSTNATTDLVASNFFSDGWYLGMRPGDMVMGCQFTSAASSVVTFWGAVASASTAGASLSTGSLVTSTFA